MKYYTMDKWIADQDLDRPGEPLAFATRKAYDEYLRKVRHLLPDRLNQLPSEVCISDSNLQEFEWNLDNQSVMLLLDAGDPLMREGRVVRLHYSGVRQFNSISDPQKTLPGPGGYGDLGYDEIEVLDQGWFEHRLLFSSGIEIAIQFQGFDYEIVDETSASNKAFQTDARKRG